MKKSEVFVKIANKKEANSVKLILKALGEDISNSYYIEDFDAKQDVLIFREDDAWILVETFIVDGEKKEVTLKELIQIISNEQQEKAEFIVLHENTNVPARVWSHLVEFSMAKYRHEIEGSEIYIMPNEMVSITGDELEEIYQAYKSLQCWPH